MQGQPEFLSSSNDPLLAVFLKARKREMIRYALLLLAVAAVMTIATPNWEIPLITGIVLTDYWFEYKALRCRVREGRFGEHPRDLDLLHGYFASQGVIIPGFRID